MTSLDNSLKDISDIRSMMERSSKFLSLSGLAGVSAGMVALLGAGAAYWRLQQPSPDGAEIFVLVDASVTLAVALICAIAFTVRMAKRKGLAVWNHTTSYLLECLLPPLSAGGILCIILWRQGISILIAPVMLMFYGLALLNTSKYTLNEVRYLALAELLLGLLAAMFLERWLFIWAAGFGLLHVVYGVFMYVKYEK